MNNNVSNQQQMKLQDPNYLFLFNNMSSLSSQIDGDLKKQMIESRVKRIEALLDELSVDEVQQWSLLHGNKINALYEKYRARDHIKQKIAEYLKALRESLILYVIICHHKNIKYPASFIEKVIKDIYYYLQNDKILEYFQAAGYNMTEFQILYHRQQKKEGFQFSLWKKWMCCCAI